MKPVVGIMGGGEEDPAAIRLAEAAGEAVARRGWILLNGGRPAGVMAASARAARAAGGFVVGVLPTRSKAPGETADLDLAIVTGMGDARNVINVLSSDVVLALPGGMGTVSEVALAVKNQTPVVLLDLHLSGPPFEAAQKASLLYSEETVETAMDRIAALLA